MTWGAVAATVGTVAVGAYNADKAGDNAIDVVETPTRQTSFEQLLTDLTTQTEEGTSSSELQSTLEQLLSSEEFQEAVTQQQVTAEQGSQASVGNETTNSQAAQEQSITRGTDESTAALNAILAGNGSGQEQVTALMSQILSDGKSNISNVGTRTGSFGSTTEQLLNNDLTAEAASAGASLQLSQNQQILDAVAAAQAGTENVTSTTDTTAATDTANNTQTATTGQQTGTTDTTGSTDTSQQQSGQSATNLESIAESATQSSTIDTNTSDTLVNPNDTQYITGQLANLLENGNIDANSIATLESVMNQIDAGTGNGNGAGTNSIPTISAPTLSNATATTSNPSATAPVNTIASNVQSTSTLAELLSEQLGVEVTSAPLLDNLGREIDPASQGESNGTYGSSSTIQAPTIQTDVSSGYNPTARASSVQDINIGDYDPYRAWIDVENKTISRGSEDYHNNLQGDADAYTEEQRRLAAERGAVLIGI